MKKIIMFGIGDFSDILYHIITEKLRRRVVAYTVESDYLKKGCMTYNGHVLVPFDTLEKMYSPEDHAVVIGMIGKRMFRQRENIRNHILAKGYSLPNIIDPSAQVDTRDMKEGNIILANSSIEAHCRIGSCNIIWQNVVLPHHNVVGSFNNLAPSVSLSGYSRIGSHCFVGNNVSVKNKTEIEDYSYIGAGAYISSPVKSYTVMVPPRSYELKENSVFDFL